tara:strand:+ start:306 stop:686 length:381 start_codon:yes stop_codon:yes gene_type:complete
MALGKIKADTLEHSTAGSLDTKFVVNGSAKSFITGTYSGGTPSNNKSLNVASIVDTATGRVTVNFSSAFDSVNYAPLSNTHQSGNIDASQNLIRNSASQLEMRFAEGGTTETDPNSFYGATHGDLA